MGVHAGKEMGYDEAIRLQVDFYLSNILWHFIKPSPDRGISAVDLLFNEFMSPEGDIKFLRGGPEKRKEIVRKVQMTDPKVSTSLNLWGEPPWGSGPWGGASEENMPPKRFVYEAVESTAVCFADIPLHCIGAHKHRYGNSGVAIGISKLNSEMLNRFEIQPVQYVPRLSHNNMNNFGNLDEDSKLFKLRDFVKVPSLAEDETPGETFDEIYAEREWRSYQSQLNFKADQVEALILPSREDIRRLSEPRRKTIGLLMAAGCSILALDSLLRNPNRSKK